MEDAKLKKIKIWLINCVIILAILVIVIITFKKQSVPVRSVGSIEITRTEKSVNIENFDDILSKLPMKSITMYEKVQEFALEDIKKVYASLKKASKKEVEKYYEENSEEIKKFLYDSKLETFENFVQQLNQMKSETLIYEQNRFENDTFKQSETESVFEMKIKYKDEADLIYRVHVTKGENEILFETV